VVHGLKRKNVALFLPFGRHNWRQLAANGGQRFVEISHLDEARESQGNV
jgi:hypothetical protein